MITMIKTLGYLATWIASIAVLAATIIFGMAQTTNMIDSIVLCSILTALAIFGMTLSFIAKLAILDKNPVCIPIIAIILVLGAVQTFEVYGWKSNIDFLFGESTQASKTDKLKIDLAQSKVKMLDVGKVDVNQIADELKAIDKADKKCTSWRFDCRRKARAGEDELRMKLEAHNESVKAIDSALSEIKSTESNSGNYVHRAFKGMAVVFDTESLKIQSIYRLTISALVVLLSHLGFVFYAGSDAKYVKLARRVMNEFNHHQPVNQTQSPAPSPITAKIKSAADNLDNRLNEIIAKGKETVMSKPSETDYEINPAFLDNRTEPRKPFMGFIDTDSLPKHARIDTVKKPIERESLSTPVDALISTHARIDTVKKASSGGTGRGLDDLEPAYHVLVESIKDRSFFKSENTVGVNSIKRVCKLGTPKAQVLMTMLIERGVNLEK